MGKTYPSEINRILNMAGGEVGKELRKVALDIAKEAQYQAVATFGKHPGDAARTGRLARSYHVKVVGGTNQFYVNNPRKYAAAMELGARAHPIYARKTVLRFRGRDGRAHRVKMVNHPGSAARNTLSTSAKLVMRRRYGVG